LEGQVNLIGTYRQSLPEECFRVRTLICLFLTLRAEAKAQFLKKPFFQAWHQEAMDLYIVRMLLSGMIRKRIKQSYDQRI